MTSVLASGYNAYNTYNSTSTSPKVRKLVKDLEANLKNLPPQERTAVANRIAGIKAAAKAEAIRTSYAQVGVSAVNDVLAFAGPVGSAIATYKTQPFQNEIDKKNQERIGKAEMIGGRRVHRKIHQQKPTADKSPVTEAARAGINDFLSGAAMMVSGAEELLSSVTTWGYDYINSLL